MLLLLGALSASACDSLGTAAKSIDRALYESVPIHPVTGRPVANLISEQQEVQSAEQLHAQIEAECMAKGQSLDSPSAHLDQTRAVFGRLIGVSHRQQLPWQVHVIGAQDVNAFTPGGGYVYVFDGLFGEEGLVREGSDDELAAVLAHEIAHVTLLHMSIARTDELISDRRRKDPFFGAAFTTEQEAEADRLSVLYMALAGYDPSSATEVWDRAARRLGSDPRQSGYLYDHPLNADRAASNRESASLVAQYYAPEKQNPDWQRILADNPLFPRAAETDAGDGAGVLRAVGATTDSLERRNRATDEARQRKESLAQTPEYQRSLVKILATRAARDSTGRPMIEMQVRNGARFPVQALGVRVTYLNGTNPLAQDPNCGGRTAIAPGQTVWLACAAHAVPGANSVKVDITGVELAQ